MSGGHGAGRSLAIGLLAAWVLTFAASFLIPPFVTPDGEGFFRGFNRVVWWFWLQVAAAAIALVLWLVRRRHRASLPQGLLLATAAPAFVTAVIVVLVTVIVAWAAY